ncbi:AMP-binding protein [Cupriavidus sp. HPC(L)]|uniref:AMP-binding protein n=1 Tax=Cupriavidus sp. HPC(L) TaxID=1217418 RepID=UPI0020A20B30|nr:AMP-binding protein [Cupriavidus sp. HPC(L)]
MMSDCVGLHELVSRLARTPDATVASGLGAAAFVQRVAAWRDAFGARQGVRWALYHDAAPEFAAALFGAWHAGKHVVLPGDTRPETLAALRPFVDGFAGELADGLLPDPGVQSQADRLAEVLSWPPLCPRLTTVTLFTSGSTGVPTGLPKRLDQLDCEVRALQGAFGAALSAGTEVLTTVSHQHIYGLLFCVLWPLAAFRRMPAVRFAFHEEIVRTAPSVSPGAVLVSSPAHLRRMPASLDWASARRALRAVFSSGGPLPADAAADAHAHLGRWPIEVYGSSETGGIAWRTASGGNLAWTPLPGVEWRIEGGLLAVRSGHLAQPGWVVGSDRVEAADGGSFVLAGRADRIVKIEEKRVSLTRIEQLLVASPLVEEVRALTVELDIGLRTAVVAVPAPAGAALLTDAGRPALIAALRALLVQALEPIALPRRWCFPAALPCNAQGKTTEAMLREMVRGVLPRVQWLPAEAPGRAAAWLGIDADLAVFDGHFEHAPIVPGVAQLDWVMTLAAQSLEVPPRSAFRQLDALKFQQVIRPGDVVRVDLDWQPERNTLTFKLASDAGQHASGRVVFCAVPGAGDV